MGAWLRFLYCTFGLMLTALPTALAADYELSLDSALLMQPSSQYYHYAYGLSAEVYTSKQSAYRLDYVERPKFESQGFVDQDRLASLSFGQVLAKSFWKAEIWSYVGLGYAGGSIQESSTGELRQYETYGPNLLAKMRWAWTTFNFGLSHEYMVGFTSSAEAAVFVAWPFSVTRFFLAYQM